ncbi:hypothetical protein GEMRC1_000532 [Eukaryota sp. GEM-RC1]
MLSQCATNCLIKLTQSHSFSTSLVNFNNSQFLKFLLSRVFCDGSVDTSSAITDFWRILRNILNISVSRQYLLKGNYLNYLLQYVVSNLDPHFRRKKKLSIVPNHVENLIISCMLIIAEDQNMTFHLFKKSRLIPTLITIISDCMIDCLDYDVDNLIPIFALLRNVLVKTDSASLFLI